MAIALASWTLVALQFALIAAIVVTAQPTARPLAVGAAVVLLAAGVAVGVAALAANRPGNFNIRPEVKDGARLVTHGIYAHVRHPMYSAVLLAMLAFVVLDARAWRIGAWIALAAVLLAKAAREERDLLARFPEYAGYRARTRRFVPRLF
jgi:protein-S-isoprenylcysteine O-methyltransferase Ste14